MSFEVECPNCGALSAPSMGICPYCKSVLSSGKSGADSASMSALNGLYKEGKIGRALAAAQEMFKSERKIASSANFLVLYAQILIESDGPQHLIQVVLGRALQDEPDNAEAHQLLEVLEAQSHLSPDLDDPGERVLRNLIRRAPDDPYAYLVLGTHLFWVQGVHEEAVRLLEKAVELRPALAKAWGCLLSIYAKMNNAPLVKRAMKNFLAFEENPSVKALVKDEMKRFSA